jgi:hypothetical protein
VERAGLFLIENQWFWLRAGQDAFSKWRLNAKIRPTGEFLFL